MPKHVRSKGAKPTYIAICILSVICIVLLTVLVFVSRPSEVPAFTENYQLENENAANGDSDRDAYPLDNTFAVYIGNSFTQGVGSSTGKTGIYELTKDIFSDSRSYTSNGSGFLGSGLSLEGMSYFDLLQEAIHDDSYDHASVTHLFLIGARGDSWSMVALNDYPEWTNRMREAIGLFEDAMKDSFPNLQYAGYAWADSYAGMASLADNETTYYTYTVNQSMPSLFKNTSINYMGWIGWNIYFDKDKFSEDGYHPNDHGYEVLAHDFAAALFGNLTYIPKQMIIEEPFKDWLHGAQINNSGKVISDPDGITGWLPAFYGLGHEEISFDASENKDITLCESDSFPIKLGSKGVFTNGIASVDLANMALCPFKEEQQDSLNVIGLKFECSLEDIRLIASSNTTLSKSEAGSTPNEYWQLIGNCFSYPYDEF